MPTPPLDPALAREAYEAYEAHGRVASHAAKALGLDRGTFVNRLRKYQDPAVSAAQAAVGTSLTPRTFWAKTDKEGNTTYSVMLRPEDGTSQEFRDYVQDVILSTVKKLPKLPVRPFQEARGSMLVLDPSDVHIGKLSVATETGHAYDEQVAEHRLVEGCRALLEAGKRNGASTVLLVIGNDIAHVDNAQKKTTSGTPQDVSGSVFDIFRAAQRGYLRVVEIALEMNLAVRVMFCPSNHDWVLGWTIAQTVAARYADHPNVEASEYGVSERHRKYLRFGRNLIMLSHGDGAKENDLPQIMLREARPHMAECDHLYAYLHHYHHKIKKHLGIRPTDREKDHIAMTVVRRGAGEMEGDNLKVEYVRSPSPPDSWHDRNGYLNRQAVEAFIHCPERGQVMRLTEWF